MPEQLTDADVQDILHRVKSSTTPSYDAEPTTPGTPADDLTTKDALPDVTPETPEASETPGVQETEEPTTKNATDPQLNVSPEGQTSDEGLTQKTDGPVAAKVGAVSRELADTEQSEKLWDIWYAFTAACSDLDEAGDDAGTTPDIADYNALIDELAGLLKQCYADSGEAQKSLGTGALLRTKAGARHSSADLATIKTLHAGLVQLAGSREISGCLDPESATGGDTGMQTDADTSGTDRISLADAFGMKQLDEIVTAAVTKALAGQSLPTPEVLTVPASHDELAGIETAIAAKQAELDALTKTVEDYGSATLPSPIEVRASSPLTDALFGDDVPLTERLLAKARAH